MATSALCVRRRLEYVLHRYGNVVNGQLVFKEEAVSSSECHYHADMYNTNASTGCEHVSVCSVMLAHHDDLFIHVIQRSYANSLFSPSHRLVVPKWLQTRLLNYIAHTEPFITYDSLFLLNMLDGYGISFPHQLFSQLCSSAVEDAPSLADTQSDRTTTNSHGDDSQLIDLTDDSQSPQSQSLSLPSPSDIVPVPATDPTHDIRTLQVLCSSVDDTTLNFISDNPHIRQMIRRRDQHISVLKRQLCEALSVQPCDVVNNIHCHTSLTVINHCVIMSVYQFIILVIARDLIVSGLCICL